MAVNVKRDRYRRMAGALTCDLGVHVGAEQISNVGVTKSMEGHPYHASAPADPGELF